MDPVVNAVIVVGVLVAITSVYITLGEEATVKFVDVVYKSLVIAIVLMGLVYGQYTMPPAPLAPTG